MGERTSVGLEDQQLAGLAVLCDIDRRGRKDEIEFLVDGRRKELGISEPDFEILVKKKLKEMEVAAK